MGQIKTFKLNHQMVVMACSSENSKHLKWVIQQQQEHKGNENQKKKKKKKTY